MTATLAQMVQGLFMSRRCKSKNIFLLLISFFLMSNLAFAAPSTDTDKKAELLRVTGKIQKIQSTLNDAQQKQSNYQSQLQTSEMKINLLTQKITALTLQLGSEQATLDTLKKRQQLLILRLTKQQNIVADHLRMSYQLGQMQALKTLLNPDNINTLSRHVYYYQYLNRSHLQKMADIKKMLETYHDTVVAIEQHADAQKKLLQQIQEQRDEQLDAQSSRQQVLVLLNEETLVKQQELTSLTANQKTLEDMLNSMVAEAQLPSTHPFNQLRGKLKWPVDGFHATGPDPHQKGLIIPAPEGTPVHAIAAGKIVFANWLRGFGLLIIINHGDGYMSLYARNQALFAQAGQIIKARDVIAALGDSGGYNSPSLYFEIRHQGTLLDSKKWCG